jgi:UDP-glucose 4-epimerase
MNKKVLITGVAGLLGANFSRYLISKGFTVSGIDDLSGGYLENIPDECKFYNFNLTNIAKVNEVFSIEKPDYVYHFAAYAAEGLSPFIRNFNYTNNLLSSVNIINACINNNTKKIIFTSSMAVYGEGSPPFEEDQLPKPEDPYGIAKYAVELDLALARKQFGLDYSIVRPHNVVGIYQNIWDKYRNVIGIWIRQAIAGEPLTIFGDGSQTRAFSDISFYNEPFEKLMTQHSGEIFNIGADMPFTIDEVSRIVMSVAKDHGFDTTRKFLEPRNEVHQAYCNHDKAKELLSFNDQTDLKESIYKMFAWAMNQKNKDVFYINYEVSKNIYDFWKKK